LIMARVVEQVDTRDLSQLGTQRGNGWREWSQIRGTLGRAAGAVGNPELSPGNGKSVET